MQSNSRWQSPSHTPVLPIERMLPEQPHVSRRKPRGQSRTAKAKAHRTSAGIRSNVRPARALPDMKYIGKQIPIQDVARALQLLVNGKAVHCLQSGYATVVHSKFTQ